MAEIIGTPLVVRIEPRYQHDSSGGPSYDAWHLDGVWWYKARPPFVLHRHYAQTVGFIEFDEIHRCACGALRYARDPFWIGKKTRLRWWP